MGFAIRLCLDAKAAAEEMNAGGMCSCCRNLLRDPVMLYSCSHVFCRKCITTWTTTLTDGKPNQTCPYCRTSLSLWSEEDIAEWEWFPVWQLNWCTYQMPLGVRSLRMKCVNEHLGCHVVSTYDTFEQHHQVCPEIGKRWQALYDQLILKDGLPLGTSSPRRWTSAWCRYNDLPE